MPVFVSIGGVIHELSGVVSASASPPPPPPAPPPAPSGRTGEEITVLMTGATSKGFTASATSEYGEGPTTAAAWKAFDGITGSGWSIGWSSSAKATVAAPQCLQLDLPTAKKVFSYKLRNRSDANNLAPTAWVFEGWDGSAWQSLHTVSGVWWGFGQVKSFDTTTQGSFTRYRWRFTDSGPLCQVAEAKLFS
jgi:hypothetical protein